MVDFTTANSALKTVYLGVLSNMLNLKTNPFFAQIKQSTKGVYGKEIKVLAPIGINGGIVATSETGELPATGNTKYVNLTSTLKNLYGKIEISDKAIRASQNSAGAFVNLLNDEMERLIEASSFNMARMLYGNGKGYISEICGISTDKKTLTVNNAQGILEGMVLDVCDGSDGTIPTGGSGFTVLSVDRATNKITFDKENTITDVAEGSMFFVVHGSLNNEITGIEALFDSSITSVYGLTKSANPFVSGVSKTLGAAISELAIIEQMDIAEANSGNPINFIVCDPAVRRKYQGLLITANKPVQTMEIEGGFKAYDFYGTPLLSDRLVDKGKMYLLNTNDFAFHQLCDWEWMCDENGSILTQKAGYAAYNATLVKYGDLICSAPYGQVRISGISLT